MPETTASPEISYLLEVDRTLLDILTQRASLYESVCAGIVRMGSEVIQTLGIPGSLTLQVVPLDAQTRVNQQFLRFTVQGTLCPYQDDLLRRVHSYVNLIPLRYEITPDDILHWLCKLATSQISSESEPDTLDDLQKDAKVTEFFGLLCSELIKRRPSVLFGSAQAENYSTLLSRHIEEMEPAAASAFPSPARLQSILGNVLDQGISLANAPEITKGISQSQECSEEEITERIIDALRSDIEIHVPLEYLRWLTTVDEDGPGGFAALRGTLFLHPGLRCPQSRFVQSKWLKPHCFALKIQHLTTLPQVDLSSELAYFLNAALDTLREYAPRLIYLTFVQEQLRQLNQYCPVLVKTIRTKVSDERLTRWLRELVAEGESIRDLRLLLEGFLDWDPNNAYTYLDRGYASLRLKNTEQAVRDFVRSREADPTYINATWMVIFTSMDRQRPGIEVAEQLKTIAAIDPSQPESHICEGVAFILKGMYKEGLAELDQVALTNPQTQDTYFWQGIAYAYLGQNQEATKNVYKALEQGLPPILLRPLYWLERDNASFYETSAVPLLTRFNI